MDFRDIRHDGKYWRVNFISRIESNWKRRLALTLTLPVFVALAILSGVILTVWRVILVAIYTLIDSWLVAPTEQLRSYFHRWNTPKPRDEA